MCIYIYIYMYLFIYIFVCLYTYVEREREIGWHYLSAPMKDGGHALYMYTYIYIYIYIYTCMFLCYVLIYVILLLFFKMAAGREHDPAALPRRAAGARRSINRVVSNGVVPKSQICELGAKPAPEICIDSCFVPGYFTRQTSRPDPRGQ